MTENDTTDDVQHAYNNQQQDYNQQHAYNSQQHIYDSQGRAGSSQQPSSQQVHSQQQQYEEVGSCPLLHPLYPAQYNFNRVSRIRSAMININT